jgi:hypothetical protein
MPTLTPENRPTIKQLIADRQADLGLSDLDVALSMGYNSPEVVAMIKSGGMRLPINKARLLADVLQVGPRDVMYMLLRDTSPEMLTGIEDCVGPLSLTDAEVRLIQKLRAAAAGDATSPLFLDGNSVVAIITKM